MKKIIKFRAWDGEYKKMIFWTLNDLLVRFNETGYGQDDKPSPFFKWMEFTGTRDKNGIDIYESDLIKFKNLIWEVVFDKGCCVLRRENNGCFVYKDLWNISQLCEVIGNIYQNYKLNKI